MSEGIDQHDGRRRRCPMLGHDVEFGYCRHPAKELPCRKIFDCWWQVFDVESFVQTYYTSEQIDAILAPPADKAATLVDLIRRAQQRAAESQDDAEDKG